jgi:hypothetical protein
LLVARREHSGSMSSILLAISYVASNAASARRTIYEFGNYFRLNADARYDVSLGVVVRAERRFELASFGRQFPSIYVWDDDTTGRALAALIGCPQPFYSGFSYGGYVNRVMILSRLAGCDYLLRVDPGTLPPVDLWSMIETQLAALQTHGIVSGVYQDRLAFRDNLYVRRSMRDDYLACIARQTGVTLQQQITGGALFMVATPGVPAIPFPEWSVGNPTLVWGSDDAIFQNCGIKSRVFTEHKVPRHDPFGKAKSPLEYFRAVVGAVYLNHLRGDTPASTSVGAFIKDLNEFLDPSLDENQGTRFPLQPDDVAPPDFLACIESGYANHLRLIGDWSNVVDHVTHALSADALLLPNP